MIFNNLRRVKLDTQLNTCLLCSQSSTAKTEIRSSIVKKHVLELEQFFDNNKSIGRYKTLIPQKLFTYTPYTRPEYLYLICPKVAKKIASYVVPNVITNKNQVVAESNPGLGFIAKELVKQGVSCVRLYEHDLEFQQILKDRYKREKNHLEFFKKDIFKLHIYSYMDRRDQGSGVAYLLEGVPKKSWGDDPVMTVVGALTEMSFLKYLIKSIVLQREIATYGRIQLYAIMFPKHWAMLNSTHHDPLSYYKRWTILFKVFFEAKFLDRFPRKLFLPWQSQRKKGNTNADRIHEDLYLIQINMRKDFSLSAEEFVPFFCFIKTFFGTGNNYLIATCEKWIPDCGINLMLPKLKHEDYFEDLTIFTKFRELNYRQILALFKEISSLPGYHKSPFSDMVEQEMMKSETISSDIHETHKYKKK